MAEFKIIELKAKAKKDFEDTWVKSAKLIPKNTKVEITKKGSTHYLQDLTQKLRETLVALGFEEVNNKYIIPDTDVVKQYGPETPVILDRAYYLATLPRPEIGLSNQKLEQISLIIGKFDKETLANILREFKKGHIEGDDFIETLVHELNIKQEQATEILNKVFPEFKKLKPAATTQTLRSHMSGTWYHTLEALQDKKQYPLALFSVGPRFRNEQKEDKGHLRVHHSASLVIMDKNMSLEAGKRIATKFFKKLGFEDVRYEVKKATSKYYAYNLEEEVFVKHNGEWLEIADIGMFSPISLANFNIKYPVFNMGAGVERLAMVLYNKSDIRELVYPQFYATKELSDEQISKLISYNKIAETAKGKELVKKIVTVGEENKNAISPCDFSVFKGKFKGKQLEITVSEPEENTKLLGPAALNEIYILDGSIAAVPPEKTKYYETAINTKLNLLEALANLFVYELENTTKSKIVVNAGMIKRASEINIKIPEQVSSFITQNRKDIKVKGPIFTTITGVFKNKS